MAKAETGQNSIKHLVLIDGYGFVFRAYHSMPPLTRPDGTPVGAVMGFTNMLLKVLADGMHADHIAVILDAGSKTFRNDIYPEYKANRPPAPEDLIPQFPLVRQAAEALNLSTIDKVGVEADDIIATYTRLAKEQGAKVTIISSDKDLMQLVDDDVQMFDAMKSKYVGIEQVQEKFGVPPEKVLDVLSLMGDSADNIPGVPGIGPKTAAQLVEEYGSLDGILERAGEIKQQKRRENLIEFADKARLSRELITLDDTVEGIPSLDSLAVRALDVEKIVPFLQEQNFKSLIVRIQKEYGGKAPVVRAVPNGNVKEKNDKKELFDVVSKSKDLESIVNIIKYNGYFSLSVVAEGKVIVGVALGVTADEAYYIPIGHREAMAQASLFDEGNDAPLIKGQLPQEEVWRALKPLLMDKSILKIGYSIKELMRSLSNLVEDISPIDDVLLLSYVLEAGLHNQALDTIAHRHLGESLSSLEEVTGKGKSAKKVSELSPEEICPIVTKQSAVIIALQAYFKKQLLEESLLTVYETIERPLVPVLIAMEREGVAVDAKVLEGLSKDFAARLATLEKEVYALAGRQFNIGSPKQLGEVLFDEMGISSVGKKPKKSSKTGAYSTGADILEELAACGHEIAEKLLQWRQISKLKSTYSDALVKQINPETGRIHTHFQMAVTTTGRLSSNDPNLQNIPVRTEEGYKIREAFVARKGCKLISADYSQIELRLLAEMADIDTLKQAFVNGEDIHAITASQIFNVPIAGMDSLTRRKAKAINFGIIYGISAFGLARQLGIPRNDAAAYIEAYFERYPGIRSYMERVKEDARQHGYVKTLYGRKCHIPTINDKQPALRSFAERAAINAPLQGTAADIIKRAMIRLHKALAEQKLQAKMILQVHDELLLEVPENEADKIAALVKKSMEEAVSIGVPIIADVGVGNNWREIH